MINVTKTYLPDINKYKRKVSEIYDSGRITNNGPLVQELESRLKSYLGVEYLVLVSNGTAALEVAYKTLGIQGEAITTPFSFVATVSSLVTSGIKPIFCDIDKESLNIDVSKIEDLISEATSAVVPVHVFGNGCEVDNISRIAKKNNLKVIYDAAHAFDVKYKGESILKWGDASTLSFHATKIFHSIEGGAIVFSSAEHEKKARLLINFGIEAEDSISELGTNAKMNEFEAAMGLCVLDDIESIKSRRAKLVSIYRNELQGLVEFQNQNTDCETNFSYFPILLSSVVNLKNIQTALNKIGIYPRRYFYPSLDTLPYINNNTICKISRDISDRILCLPLYESLTESEQSLIIDKIKSNLQCYL